MPSFLLALLLLYMSPSLVWAANADPRAQLQDVETTLQSKKTAAIAAAQAAKASLADLAKIQDQLQAAAQDEATQQTELDKLLSDQEELRSKTAAARESLAETAQRGTAAVAMMVRLSQLPAAAWWIYDGVSLAQERRMLLLRSITTHLGEQAEAMRRELANADALQASLTAKQAQLSTAKAGLETQAASLNELIAQRQAMARTHQAEHDALQQDMTKLAANASDLRGLLDKMARQEKAPKPSKAVLIDDNDKVAITANNANKAKFMPVVGELVRGYGGKDSFGIVSRGITLRAQGGTRIVAPLAGKAVFVGPFKGYGMIVILQHSKGMHSLLAGFGKIDLVLGQTVLTGEPIGMIGKSAAKPAIGQEGNKGSAELYFELRRDGEPIDPMILARSPS